MADKKLTYQMVSPGEAWNNFVNSKDGHNAAAVTPAYLDNSNPKPVEKNLAPDKADTDVRKPKLFQEALLQKESQNGKDHSIEKEELTMEK